MDVHAKVLAAVGESEAARSVLVEAEARIEEGSNGRWKLQLTLAGSGTRELDAASCRELADAAVLILAIAIDPEALERIEEAAAAETASESESESEPVTESESDSDSDLVPAPAVAPAPKNVARTTEPRLHLDLQLGGGAAFGLLPDPGGWVAAGFGLWGRWWRAEIEGSYTTPSEEAAPGTTDVRGRLQTWAIGVRAGPAIPAGDVVFPIAVGIEAGGMHGKGVGSGLMNHDASTAAWVGFFGGAAALWRPPVVDRRLGFGLRVEGIAALTRPRFGTEARTVYQTRPGGARVAVVFAVRLR